MNKRRKVFKEGTISLGDNAIPCFVLEDKTRVLSGRAFQEALRIREKPENEGKRGGYILPKFLASKPINEFIIKKIAMAKLEPIICYHGNRKIHGYEATLLADVCDALLDARNSGVKLTERQQIVAMQSEILIRSFAKVGIIALVDEATGYQEIRDKEEIQNFLKKFIREEYARWARKFEPSLLEDISRLKGWEYKKGTNKYYPAMGHVLNDLVYKRLAPGVLAELKRVNPVQESGHRKVKHHQHLSEKIGVPALEKHLTKLEGFAETHTVWRKFYEQVNRAFPPYDNPQLYLEFPDTDIGEPE